MSSQPLIVNKEEFLREAVVFFNTIFEPALNSEFGEIEIRVFPKDRPPRSSFHSSIATASQLCIRGPVSMGLAPSGNGSIVCFREYYNTLGGEEYER